MQFYRASPRGILFRSERKNIVRESQISSVIYVKRKNEPIDTFLQKNMYEVETFGRSAA